MTGTRWDHIGVPGHAAWGERIKRENREIRAQLDHVISPRGAHRWHALHDATRAALPHSLVADDWDWGRDWSLAGPLSMVPRPPAGGTAEHTFHRRRAVQPIPAVRRAPARSVPSTAPSRIAVSEHTSDAYQTSTVPSYHSRQPSGDGSAPRGGRARAAWDLRMLRRRIESVTRKVEHERDAAQTCERQLRKLRRLLDSVGPDPGSDASQQGTSRVSGGSLPLLGVGPGP
eukprot:TRINITY_DN55193_c0_g1_i1.p2 TRINITY_DN55193_c0_g1~~TRINITY_DN55193_c0_g1_i1.p2  ORF type:complete len:255 (+),score=56.78 TRINITY_DN55193_c0_g1_i1:78-767(+)